MLISKVQQSEFNTLWNKFVGLRKNIGLSLLDLGKEDRIKLAELGKIVEMHLLVVRKVFY